MGFHGNNSSTLSEVLSEDTIKMELYSTVLSATTLCLAILFGGGGCVTVVIAMCVHKLMKKLRFILIAVLLLVCCAFDFIWCPVEISRLILYHQININGNTINSDTIAELKYLSHSMYILLLCALAAIIVVICIQNLLKMVNKYDSIPKMKFGIILLLFWLLISISLTIAYVMTALNEDTGPSYHTINNTSFHFKLVVQSVWIILLLIPLFGMLVIHIQRNIRPVSSDKESELSDLHSNENFTVPTLLIKSVEELEEENEEQDNASPSPEIKQTSHKGSPASQSAMKKRRGSPSSQKVNFADDLPSPSRERGSTNFENECKPKTQNHLGVNMAAILGRRRHTIAQISDPHLDLIQKAKQYNYVRKFSVDVNALQAQLENPKLHGRNNPFHSETDIQTSGKSPDFNKENSLREKTKIFKPSMEDMCTDDSIAEQPEECDEGGDSICPTPPLISLTQSDGEEKPLEMNTKTVMKQQSQKPCKLSCVLVGTFLCCILPMFITEAVRHYLSPNAYINIITCTMAVSVVQTMIYPQIIFCMDTSINKAVHHSLLRTRHWIFGLFYQQDEVATADDISDTEV